MKIKFILFFFITILSINCIAQVNTNDILLTVDEEQNLLGFTIKILIWLKTNPKKILITI